LRNAGTAQLTYSTVVFVLRNERLNFVISTSARPVENFTSNSKLVQLSNQTEVSSQISAKYHTQPLIEISNFSIESYFIDVAPRYMHNAKLYLAQFGQYTKSSGDITKDNYNNQSYSRQGIEINGKLFCISIRCRL